MSTEVLAGKTLELDADGHLAHGTDWTREVAAALAAAEGIPALTERHWAVINYMRKEFEKNGQAPSIRKLTKESGVDTKELYGLFPNGPAKKAARIGGLPKPVGCI